MLKRIINTQLDQLMNKQTSIHIPIGLYRNPIKAKASYTLLVHGPYMSPCSKPTTSPAQNKTRTPD